MRDWLNVQTQRPEATFGRILLATPHEVAVNTTAAIRYGTIIEEAGDGYVLPMLKRAIFHAVKDALTESSIA